MSKKLYYSLQTTGTEPEVHGIYQIGAIIEIDGTVKEKINMRFKPQGKAKIDNEFMTRKGMSMERLKEFPGSRTAYMAFTDILTLFIDKYNKNDKFFLIGYNNRLVHDRFLKAFMAAHGDEYFGAYFWNNTVDLVSNATTQLMEVRTKMANFKLCTVAPRLGITISEHKYDALQDALIIRQLYPILTNNVQALFNEQSA